MRKIHRDGKLACGLKIRKVKLNLRVPSIKQQQAAAQTSSFLKDQRLLDIYMLFARCNIIA